MNIDGAGMIGASVSHYRVLQQLGAGGMGVVYLAEDIRLNRKVALKFLSPDSRDPQAEARLLREAQAASALDHANIATVYEIGEWNGQLFIAMAAYSGETLRDRIARGSPPISEITSIVAQIADGLAAAHAQGIVHRDLKPANVMITPTGQVKVLDFGLAKLVSSEQETALAMTGRGTAVGTVAYMAPEQALGHAVDQRADIWALGAVTYELLTGRRPFQGDTLTAVLLAIATEEPTPARTLRPELPPELERIIGGALQKDPARRKLTAPDIASQLASYRARVSSGAIATLAPAARSRWRLVAAAAVGLAAVVASVAWWNSSAGAKRRWALNEAMPEIQSLVEQQKFVAAYGLVAEARRHLGDDPAFATLRATVVRPVTIRVNPPGAEVFFAEYAPAAEPSWHRLGETPIEKVDAPRGLLRWKVEKAGFNPSEDVTGASSLTLTLDRPDAVPEGMARASGPATPFQIYINGLEVPTVRFPDFWIDRVEVTNRDFKRFVDAGGYEKPEYWKHEFFKDGRRLSRDEAMALFRDATGRTAPATWELGTYPAGQDDHPVTGVSWYEAAAYAEFAGKSLPTIYHWDWVASYAPLTFNVIPLGNYASGGPVAVGSTRALHRFGTYDLAGNVKEWCANEAEAGKRYILGGGWDEPPYMFPAADARSPLERSSNFGFRCVRYLESDQSRLTLAGFIAGPTRNYARERPVRDDVFDAYKRLYSYDRTPVTAVARSADDTSGDWRRESATFPAPYGDEKITAHLWLPKRSRPPFQPVILFPGSSAWDLRSVLQELSNPRFEFLVKSGRALVVPIYKGSYERGTDQFRSDYPKETSVWRDHVIAWYKDFARTIDYLETRRDIAIDKIGFFGVSLGGAMGPILLALEPRVKAAVLVVPGLFLQRPSPEVDVINFVPRVKQPVLVLNGRYDYTFPEAASQVPFFRLLGTAEEHKRRVTYASGHNPPTNDVYKETLDWLDRYLGPVK